MDSLNQSLIEKLHALAEQGNSKYVDVKQAIAIIRQHEAEQRTGSAMGRSLPNVLQTANQVVSSEISVVEQHRQRNADDMGYPPAGAFATREPVPNGDKDVN